MKGLLGHPVDRLAVDQHAARLGIVEALEHSLQDGRLAGARRADDADLLPGGDVDRNVVQHRAVRIIAEGDVFQADRTLTAAQGRCARRIDDLVRRADDVECLPR